MTSISGARDARSVLIEMASHARRREIVAFTLRGLDDPAMFVDLPLGGEGPVFAWVGLWRRAEDQRVGARPHTVIATAPAKMLSALRGDVERSYPFTYVIGAARDETAVVVASDSTQVAKSSLARVTNIEPLLTRWLESALAPASTS